MWFPGCPPARPSAVGADSISARVTLRRRGVARDDASIVPYRGCNNAGFEISRVAANPPLDVGEGFIPPAGVRAAAGPGGMRASRPTAARVVTATLLAATFTMVRRGGPRSSRKTFSNILSRPQGGDPPYLNSELFTLNSELPTLNFRPATA